MAPPSLPAAPQLGTKIIHALRSWRHLLRERYLQRTPAHLSPYPPSWDLDPHVTRDLVIHWPERYSWHSTHQWVDHLLRGLQRYVRIERKPLPQPDGCVVMLELVSAGKTYPVAIDFADYLDQIDEKSLANSLVYFKMQHRREGYGSDKIVPGGYVNPSHDYYRYIASLRMLQSTQMPRFDVYGRFGLEFAQDIRRRAVAMLAGQDRFHYEGSLTKVRYHRSLEEAACARVCIDLPGNGDFCFRLIDYLGIGTCVVAAPHRTIMHVPLQDRKHIVYAKEDLSDLVELCRYYLEHDGEREAIVQQSREYFDRYLHQDQLAAYYLWTALQKMQ